MIIGRQFAEKLYSENEEIQEEKLYSTGDDYLDYLLEKAFCEGYEYAQREFAGKSNPSLNFMQTKGNKVLNKSLERGRLMNNATSLGFIGGAKNGQMIGKKASMMFRTEPVNQIAASRINNTTGKNPSNSDLIQRRVDQYKSRGYNEFGKKI